MPRLRSRIILLVAVFFVVALAGALSLSPAAARWAHAQTVPTITPTPGDDATSPPGPTSASPTEEATTPPQEQPTTTRPPAGRATATRSTTTGAATGSPTPTAILRGTAAAHPTAEACSLEPTVLVLDGGAWVYEGPGEDYDRLGRLDEDTVRPIVARAAYGEWWLIGLDDDETGWIADANVEVQGDTGELPLEDAPALPNGRTPTPGPTWEPTPNRDCVTPTATPTATEEPTSTSTPTETATAAPTATVTPVPAATDEVEPLPVEEEGSSLMWLPVAGIVLLAAGALLYVTRRS